MPFLPVKGATPEFLGSGRFTEGPEQGILLVMGTYGNEATAWLWSRVDVEHPQPRRLGLGGTGMPFPVLRDMNEDGLDDLAYLTEGQVNVRLSSAGEPLAETLAIGTEGRPTGLVSGDFNGDGHADLVASFNPDYTANQLYLFAGDGQGSLRYTGRVLQIGGGDPPLAVADFNGDQVDDLVVVDNDAGILLAYFGAEEPFRRFHAVTVKDHVGAVAAGDFNQDGLADLALTSSGGLDRPGRAEIWTGTGDGDAPFAVPQVLDIRRGLDSVQAQDFNGDGLLDLLFLPRFDPGGYQLLLRDPDQLEGDWPGWRADTLPISPRANAVALTDLNGDGINDLVGLARIGNASQGVVVVAGAADGWLAPVRLTGPGDVWAVATADFNGDGREDLAVARSQAAPDVGALPEATAGRVELYLNSGDRYRLSASQPSGRSPLALLAVDWNGDGATDLLSADYGSGQVSRFLGDGQGGLQAVDPLSVGLNPIALTAGDVSGDGQLDLLVANATSGEVNVFLGMGDDQISRASDLFIGNNPWALALADFDGDGRLDLAVAQANFNVADEPGQVLLYPGQEDGSFGQPSVVAVGPNPTDLAVADFDGNGLPDLAVAFSGAMTTVEPPGSPSGDGVALLLNRGEFTFDQVWRSQDVLHPHHLLAEDFNGDRVVDLAVGGASGGSPWLAYRVLTLLLGSGDGRFGDAQYFGDGEAVQGLAALDANADGRLDLILAQPGSGARLFSNSPSLAPTVVAAPPESPPANLFPVTEPAPNPAPGYPAAWQPLVVAGQGRIELPDNVEVWKLAFNVDAGLLYALDSNGTIHVLSSITLQPEAAWPINARDFLLDAEGQRLFVSRKDADETLVLDPVTGRQQGAIPRAGRLALDTRRNRLYIVHQGVWLADPDSGRVLGALPASFKLFTGYVYSPGNLTALYDPAGDRLVVKGTLGGPGSSGSVQHTDVYDAETLARLPLQYSRSYWLLDMAVNLASGEFYATAASMDSSVRQISFFDRNGRLTAELAGVGGWILQGSQESPIYLVDLQRIVTVDVSTHSVVDFTPLPDEPTAAAGEPGTDRLVVAMPEGKLLVFVPSAAGRPRPGPGTPQPGLPTGRAVLELHAEAGQGLLLARVAGPSEQYGWPRELYRSTDGGQTWQRIDDGLLGAYARQVVVEPNRGELASLWIVAFHGAQPAGVFRAYEAGDFWQLADLGLRHLRLTDLELAPGTQDTLFALSSQRRLYRSEDRGSNWQQVLDHTADFLLSPHFGDDGTIWARRSGDLGVVVSTDGGDTWQTSQTSDWWQESAEAAFFFSPGWPEEGAVYRIARDAAWIKSAGSNSWQPFSLPKPREYLEEVALYFMTDSQFLVFYREPLAEEFPGLLYWTDDGGTTWQLLLAGQAPDQRLTALTVDPQQFAQDGSFWLGTSAGQVQRYQVTELLAAGRAVQITPTATPTPQPPLSAGDRPPSGLVSPDPRFAPVWEQVSAQLGWGTAAGQSMFMAWQPFEHGAMVWLSAAVPGSGIDGPTVLVMIDEDGWQAIPDTWDESQPESDPSLTAPAGLVQPIRGFGKVWREQPGVREGLGWGLAAEAGFDGLVQAFEHGLMVNVNARTYALIGDERGSTWRVVQ